ncbi:hypothetical protein KAT92_03500 [Candidatus Babeliales bacterium]|nr:hypothetical protein [Candidatus Babeliales bacterium]
MKPCFAKTNFIKAKLITLLALSICCSPLAAATRSEIENNLTKSFEALTKTVANQGVATDGLDKRVLERLYKKQRQTAKDFSNINDEQLKTLSNLYATLVNAHEKTCKIIWERFNTHDTAMNATGLSEASLKRRSPTVAPWAVANMAALLILADNLFAYAKYSKEPAFNKFLTDSYLKDVATKAKLIADTKTEIYNISFELGLIHGTTPRSNEDKNALRSRKKELQASRKTLSKNLEELEDFSELGDSTFFKIKSCIGAHPYITAATVVATVVAAAGGAYAVKTFWWDKRGQVTGGNDGGNKPSTGLTHEEIERFNELSRRNDELSEKCKKRTATKTELEEIKTNYAAIESFIVRTTHEQLAELRATGLIAIGDGENEEPATDGLTPVEMQKTRDLIIKASANKNDPAKISNLEKQMEIFLAKASQTQIDEINDFNRKTNNPEKEVDLNTENEVVFDGDDGEPSEEEEPVVKEKEGQQFSQETQMALQAVRNTRAKAEEAEKSDKRKSNLAPSWKNETYYSGNNTLDDSLNELIKVETDLSKCQTALQKLERDNEKSPVDYFADMIEAIAKKTVTLDTRKSNIQTAIDKASVSEEPASNRYPSTPQSPHNKDDESSEDTGKKAYETEYIKDIVVNHFITTKQLSKDLGDNLRLTTKLDSLKAQKTALENKIDKSKIKDYDTKMSVFDAEIKELSRENAGDLAQWKNIPNNEKILNAILEGDPDEKRSEWYLEQVKANSEKTKPLDDEAKEALYEKSGGTVAAETWIDNPNSLFGPTGVKGEIRDINRKLRKVSKPEKQKKLNEWKKLFVNAQDIIEGKATDVSDSEKVKSLADAYDLYTRENDPLDETPSDEEIDSGDDGELNNELKEEKPVAIENEDDDSGSESGTEGDDESSSSSSEGDTTESSSSEFVDAEKTESENESDNSSSESVSEGDDESIDDEVTTTKVIEIEPVVEVVEAEKEAAAANENGSESGTEGDDESGVNEKANSSSGEEKSFDTERAKEREALRKSLDNRDPKPKPRPRKKVFIRKSLRTAASGNSGLYDNTGTNKKIPPIKGPKPKPQTKTPPTTKSQQFQSAPQFPTEGDLATGVAAASAPQLPTSGVLRAEALKALAARQQRVDDGALYIKHRDDLGKSKRAFDTLVNAKEESKRTAPWQEEQ